MRSRPATEEKILRALSAADVLCDDCLADLAAVRPRQQANKRARALVLQGRVFREQGLCPRCRHARIVNRLPRPITPRLPLGSAVRKLDGRPWFTVERLREHGVIVRDLPGLGWVRASIGFWTSDDEIERLVENL